MTRVAEHWRLWNVATLDYQPKDAASQRRDTRR